MVAIPERILANWREWFGSRAEGLADDVGTRARDAIDAWGLESARVMSGGEVALVLEATRDGIPVICKLSPPDPSLAHESKALASWSGICPQLLGARDGGLTMLLERLDPGAPLAGDPGSIKDQLRVLGELAGRIHRAPAPDAPRLADSELAEEWSGALSKEADRAELAQLLEGDGVVIHTDLHAENVLRHGDAWRAIDPKPFRAMPEAEIWGLIDEAGLAAGRERQQMTERLAVYCEAGSLDPELARRWARLRALAEAGSLTARQETWRGELERVAAALG